MKFHGNNAVRITGGVSAASAATATRLACCLACVLLLAVPSCRNGEGVSPGSAASADPTESSESGTLAEAGAHADVSRAIPRSGWVERREERDSMVDRQIEARGIEDARVLAAMRAVPRHFFVPMVNRTSAYADHPLPIGDGQTISQPYIVALMTELMRLEGTEKVLEIGTGSGYQAAILAEVLGAGKPGPRGRVFTIEIVASLAERSKRKLAGMGFDNVTCRCGDGYAGWPGEAPFDAIMVTAAPDHVPQPLLDQLADGGRLVMPVGDYYQELVRITRRGDAFERERVTGVRFVPMTGAAREK